jgi:hypothetical protein
MLNVPNIAGALCMWSAVPAFGAIVYCPVMVLGKRTRVCERPGLWALSKHSPGPFLPIVRGLQRVTRGAASRGPSLPPERPLFIRERHGGLYGTGTYLLSRVVEGGFGRSCCCCCWVVPTYTLATALAVWFGRGVALFLPDKSQPSCAPEHLAVHKTAKQRCWWRSHPLQWPLWLLSTASSSRALS